MMFKIFFCYAREDEVHLNKLQTHLTSLELEGLIETWYDRKIDPGVKCEKEIREKLDMAQIILLLISPDFLASEYCRGVEMKLALERHERGEARVIPIIVRHVHWRIQPLHKLQALPMDAKPITSWADVDAACFDVTDGIRRIIQQLSPPKSIFPSFLSSSSPTTYTPVSPQPSSAVIPQDWALLHTHTAHTDRVTSVAISADSQTLVSGSRDHTAKVWNLHTGELIHTLVGHSEAVMSVAISENGRLLVTGSKDTTVRLWFLQTGELIRTLSGHSEAVMSVAISENGQWLASGSLDRTLKLWDLQTETLSRTLEHTGRVVSVAVSSDVQIVASATIDKTVKLWSLETGRLRHTLEGHT